MPKLSLIESEAARFVGHLPEAERRTLQQALIDLCEARWLEIRGPEPATSLAHALWSATPPLADLLADLHAAGDGRLDEVLRGRKVAQGFALLVMAEIERGNAEGVRLAHEPMMLSDSPAAGTRYAEDVAAALRGEGEALHLHPHASKPALWKALACIVAHTGRCDLDLVIRVIGLLVARPAADQAADEALEQLRNKLGETGVHFLGIDDDHIQLEVHGHEHQPVSAKQLGEMLGEIRHAWLR
ncbi:MAG TPA: hypothetical protein VMV97_00285 [Sulfuriferula sp.]|nr:hypothetical protein [Sulfuriferula sp.]